MFTLIERNNPFINRLLAKKEEFYKAHGVNSLKNQENVTLILESEDIYYARDWLIEKTSKINNVAIATVGSYSDINKAIDQVIANGNTIKAVVIRAHGNEEEIWLVSVEKAHTLKPQELFNGVIFDQNIDKLTGLKKINSTAQIVLASCHSWSLGEKVWKFAGEQREVICTKDGCDVNDIQYTPQFKFFKATFPEIYTLTAGYITPPSKDITRVYSHKPSEENTKTQSLFERCVTKVSSFFGLSEGLTFLV